MEKERITPPEWPRLMGAELAARYLSIGRTLLSRLGPMPKRLGRRKLYDRRDLDQWADQLGENPQPEKLDPKERERRFLEKLNDHEYK